jgi:monofunctional biosynthetic peptidoglycan transglycosylase
MLPAGAVSHCYRFKQSMVRQDDTSEPTAAPPGVNPAAQPFEPQLPSDGLAAASPDLPAEAIREAAGETAEGIALTDEISATGVPDTSLSPPRPLPPWAFAEPRGFVTHDDRFSVEPPDHEGRALPSDTSPADGDTHAPLAMSDDLQSLNLRNAAELPLTVEAALAEIDAEAAVRSLTAVQTALTGPLGHATATDDNQTPFEPRLAQPPPPAFPALVADPSFRHGLAPPARHLETPRDYKALAKRAGKLAAMIAGGWLAVVLMLIVAYRFVNPPISALMLQQWLLGQDIAHEWVPIEDMSPNIVRAVLLSEDGRFCEHYGVDYEALREAVERAGTGSLRGASTISMQVIKNLFLWPSKSFLRKAIELPLTYVMELIWPKRRIMEVYLNIAEWGPGIFGVGKAAAFHFNKSARSLSEREAARLAAALPNPLVRSASRPGPGTQRLAGAVQVRMRLAPTSQIACVLPKRRI